MHVEELPARRCCVRRHDGPVSDVDRTRRPMYQHMISHELVGGASMLRFHGSDAGPVDVLIGATCGFDGDDVVAVEDLPAGRYAVADYEGPESGIEAARDAFLASVRAAGHTPAAPVVQVHLMDAFDDETEQRFEVLLS